MHPKPDEYVFYRGKKFQVEFYFNDKGELPAKEYFDAADRQVKIKLLALVKYIAEEGSYSMKVNSGSSISTKRFMSLSRWLRGFSASFMRVKRSF